MTACLTTRSTTAPTKLPSASIIPSAGGWSRASVFSLRMNSSAKSGSKTITATNQKQNAMAPDNPGKKEKADAPGACLAEGANEGRFRKKQRQERQKSRGMCQHAGRADD